MDIWSGQASIRVICVPLSPKNNFLPAKTELLRIGDGEANEKLSQN